MLEGLCNTLSRFGVVAVEDAAPGCQLGLEPIERFFPQPSPSRLVGRRIVVALAAAGQRRGAGRVIGVLGLPIVGELRVVVEGRGIESRGGRVQALLVTECGEVDALGRVGRLVLPRVQTRQPLD